MVQSMTHCYMLALKGRAFIHQSS